MNNNEDFESMEQIEKKSKKEKSPIDQSVKKRRRKSKISLSIFVLLLAVGVVGNWYWENSSISEKIKPVISSNDENSSKTLGEASFVDATTETTTKANDYFTTAKLNRETARDEVLDNLQAVVDSSKKSDDAKTIASEDIARISSYISVENKIETLVMAKNISNCLAVVSDDGGSVEVIVDEQDLSEKTIVQIKEIAIKQLGCTYENVSIIQAK